MIKDVWHTTKEKPMLHRDIVLCGDGWSMAIDIIPETVNNICWKNVEKWCYLDDLIKENEHTRKKLDICVKALNKIANTDIKVIEKGPLYYARAMFWVTNNTLGRIQDIEQKDVK